MNPTTSTDADVARLGAVSRKRVRERAIELAVGQGRSAHETTKSDWEQAKLELIREPAPGQDVSGLALSRRVAGPDGAEVQADGETARTVVVSRLVSEEQACAMSISPSPAALETPLAAPAAALSEATPTAAQRLYALIEDQPFFKGIGAPHLQRLADSAIEMRFESEQVIFEEGSPANRFFLILEGKVLLEAEVRDRGVMAIQTLGAGDDLGWSWLFPPYYLHSSARALEPTRMIFFHGTRLREQCEEDHDLGYEIMRRIAKVVIQRLGVTQQRLMDCAGPDQATNG